jgi:hypothetical protein
MAVDYTDELEADWIIFPLHAILRTAEGVRCACGDLECSAIGKHPKASNWQHTQPYDDEQLALLEDHDGEWFGNQLLDNHGVVVATSGLLVVDVDGRNGGFESAAQLAHIREQAGYIVRTGSGNGEHWYFTVPADWTGKSLSGTLRDYPGIDFKSTGFVVGTGCEHESGNRYEAMLGSPATVTEAPLELMRLLDRPERTRFVMDGAVADYTNDDLRSMVAAIPNPGRDYEKWIRVGMALHDATDGNPEGYEMWLDWSSQSDAHDDSMMDRKWYSFGKSASVATVGTLITWARESGWQAPVTFTDNTDWGDIAQPVAATPKAPAPEEGQTEKYGGIVGAVFDWIDGQCLFPRKHITLAAALMAVSSAASLRYRVDPKYRVSLNLMIFCIADSGTGKEAVYQGLLQSVSAAGLAPALYGKIKSEQELYRNAIRHQLAAYALDECGAMLGKIGSAKKRGGAAYLEGIPTAIMEIFTKVNGFLPLGGDMRDELKKALEIDYAKLMKRKDDGRGDARTDEQLADLRGQMAQISQGLKNPMLGFFGITEPSSFDAAISNDRDLMVNGFLGRALMFREDDPLPLRRANFQPYAMPMPVAARLAHLYSDGHASAGNGDDEKIHLIGDHEIIPIEPAAEALLDEVYTYWRGQGQALAMDGQGIHSITTRVWEMVVKVAGLLALPLDPEEKAVIRRDHVRQAHAIVRRVTEYKISHCKTAIGADSNDTDERSQGLETGVRTIIDGMPEGVGAGIVRNRLRNYSRENVDKCLKWLVERGEVEAVEYLDARNRKHVKYIKRDLQ